MYIEPSSADLASTWAPRTETNEEWREIDRALRGIAGKRAALDADEARWLREADRIEIWKQVGMVSALDYMERILGYAPRTAQERLRVARALGDMPKLEQAMQTGDLAFSAVREVSRVATPETEALWAEFATGVSLRDIEEVVASHARGDKPTDPAKPIVRDRKVTFELPPETYAMLRQVQTLATEEHGRHLEAHEVLAEALRAFLDRGPRSERTGADQYTIALTVCEACKQGWQTGAGQQVAVDASVVERASCDALHVGSLDGDLPNRARHGAFSPAVARFIWLRDQGRCQTPGCRSTVGLAIHHIDPRANNGSSDPSNGTVRCFLCRARHNSHYAAYPVMPRSASVSVEDTVLCAA